MSGTTWTRASKAEAAYGPTSSAARTASTARLSAAAPEWDNLPVQAEGAAYERVPCVVTVLFMADLAVLGWPGEVVLVRPTAAEMRRRGLASWTREDGDV